MASASSAALKRFIPITIFVLLFVNATALDNGLALTPAMGFSTWYSLHHHLLTPSYEWEKGYVLSDDVLDVARWMKDNGYLALGYKYINFADCVVVNRTSEGRLVLDPQAFPNGENTVLNVSKTLHAMGFKFGWGLKRPGSEGHEKIDAETYAAWGVDYLKDDSCYASHLDAVDQYAAMRDALNATKRSVYFNLCWPAGETVAKVGKTLGNEWRVAIDDGGGWIPIMKNVEVGSTFYPLRPHYPMFV
ncbi:probable alpha-galactosidase [Oscarella lobularis]|uniref:probable alpha-galactosidase n=1 Tax=Oscarella lobularis TaxID=121494 RepID=UPI003313EB2A